MSNLTSVRIDSDGSRIVTTVSEDMRTLSVFNVEKDSVSILGLQPPDLSMISPTIRRRLYTSHKAIKLCADAVQDKVFILDNIGCVWGTDEKNSRWIHADSDVQDFYLDQTCAITSFSNCLTMWKSQDYCRLLSTVEKMHQTNDAHDYSALPIVSNSQYKIIGFLHRPSTGEKIVFLQAITIVTIGTPLVSSQLCICQPKLHESRQYFQIDFPSKRVKQSVVYSENTIYFLTEDNFLVKLYIPPSPSNKADYRMKRIQLPAFLYDNEKYFLFKYPRTDISPDKIGITSCKQRIYFSSEDISLLSNTPLDIPGLNSGDIVSCGFDHVLKMLVVTTSLTGKKSVHATEWSGDTSPSEMMPNRHKTLTEGISCTIL